MTFSVTVQLSDALKSQLETPGVYAYGVYFTDNGATPNWLPQALSNGSGTVVNSQTFDIDVPYVSGKIYFIISSGTNVQSQITSEADLSWANASSLNFRYDSVELTVQDNSFDVANLTDVNAFGIAMSISNGLGGAAGTRGYNVSGSEIFDAVINSPPTYNGFSAPNSNLYEWTGPLTGPRMVAAPADATATGFPSPPPAVPFTSGDWTNYVDALKTATQPIVISGWFNGAPDAGNIWHNAGYYAYELAWDGTNFWLNPLESSQVKGSLMIAPDGEFGLTNSIYASYGQMDVYDKQGGTALITDMNVGANNQWGAVFRDFTTGFTAGYYGATGTSPYGAAHGSNIDLSNNANWDPTYAFGANATNAFGSNAAYDKYAQYFYANTNSYGSGYSDNLMKALPDGPLMTLWNGTGNTPLTITLFADSDTPSTAKFNNADIGMGFAGAPVMDNYIAPVSTGPHANAYVDLTDIGNTATFASANSFTLNFAGSSVFLDPGSTVQIGFWNGTGFTYLTVPTTESSFWNNYTLTWTGTAFQFSTVTNPSSPGSIGVTGLPVAADGTVGWYQVVVTGTGTDAWTKTFNIYATTDPSSAPTTYQFVNPNVTPGSVAADGLAVPQADDAPPSPPATVTGLTFAFLTGSGFGLDPSVIERNATAESIANPGNATYTSPFAPVIGSVSGGVFTNFMANPGVYTVGPTPNAYLKDANNNVNPTSVHTTQQTFPDGATFNVNLVTYQLADTITKTGQIAFSWWGADTNWVTVNSDTVSLLDHTPATDIVYDPSNASTFGSRWNPANLTKGYAAGQYTNKVGALNVAQVEFVTSDASGTYSSHAPISVTADLDGVWMTNNTLFLNGTYKAVLMEYDPLFPGVAVNKASDGIVFTVGVSSSGSSITGGSSIAFDPGISGADGTWVRLDTTGSTLLNGTLLVYFTDGSGQMLSRVDDSVTSVLDLAVRTQIGLVKTDGGGLMFGGEQSVYLPANMLMKFAIQTDNGAVQQLPDIQVTGSGSLSVSVAGAGGTLNLSAALDSSPGANANLALSQQEYGHAWFYLTQGQTLQVDVAGSAWNVNTLHFLHIDVDPGDPGDVADWSVDGVDWGNTPAFRAAVQAGWDPGYAASGGRGNFNSGQQWTASQSGYYAPVLVAENGDIFVIGSTANSDGQSHIRTFGQNMFGFEDQTAAQGSDWDYNDLVMKLSVL